MATMEGWPDNPNWLWGWHFVESTGRLTHCLSSQKVKAGEAYFYDLPISRYSDGLHASQRALSALHYAPGPIACRVVLSGVVIRGNARARASERLVVAMADASKTLHEFACLCAEDALAHISESEVFQAAKHAIETKRDWIAGRSTDKGLFVALCAARRAAGRTVSTASSSAARSAIASASNCDSWSAALLAASAAQSAASFAARLAVTSATSNDVLFDVWSTALSVAQTVQNNRLEAMLNDLLDLS